VLGVMSGSGFPDTSLPITFASGSGPIWCLLVIRCVCQPLCVYELRACPGDLPTDSKGLKPRQGSMFGSEVSADLSLLLLTEVATLFCGPCPIAVRTPVLQHIFLPLAGASSNVPCFGGSPPWASPSTRLLLDPQSFPVGSLQCILLNLHPPLNSHFYFSYCGSSSCSHRSQHSSSVETRSSVAMVTIYFSVVQLVLPLQEAVNFCPWLPQPGSKMRLNPARQ
jgi:hypothetical protein